jgi:L-amino acid N-acyltransferase YncA
MDVEIRSARVADLAAINEIYNHYVLHSTATFQEHPLSEQERLMWWRAHEGTHPVLVAEQAGRVIGWAAVSAYIQRCAYRFTVEDSIYLLPEACGGGLGRRLLGSLLQHADAAGFRNVLALISAEGEASLRLHAGLGFERVGLLMQVGFKFGRWIDVVLMQRRRTGESPAGPADSPGSGQPDVR